MRKGGPKVVEASGLRGPRYLPSSRTIVTVVRDKSRVSLNARTQRALDDKRRKISEVGQNHTNPAALTLTLRIVRWEQRAGFSCGDQVRAAAVNSLWEGK